MIESRARVSMKSLANSLGTASNTVSSMMPNGLVRRTNANWAPLNSPRSVRISMARSQPTPRAPGSSDGSDTTPPGENGIDDVPQLYPQAVHDDRTRLGPTTAELRTVVVAAYLEEPGAGRASSRRCGSPGPGPGDTGHGV